MKRLFEIQTLSECSPKLSNYIRLSDPVSIITGGVAIISQLFPNLFGGTRTLLTDSNWQKLIPGNGFVTTALRNFLKVRIRYNEDLQKTDPGSGKSNLEAFTIYFAQNQSMLWCPDGSCQGNSESVLMPKFYAILRKEAATAGNLPIGTVPGFISGFGGLDTSTLLIIGGSILLLFALNKKKKRK